MSDVADDSDTHIEETFLGAMEAISIRANAIPLGKPGECDMCGEWSGRLVKGNCAPCRDKWRLP